MRALVASLLAREPNASHIRLDAETLTKDALAEYLGGRGLFARRVLVVLDRTFERDEAKNLVLERTADIAASENVFVVLEGALDAETRRELERRAEKTQAFDQKPKTKNQKQEFSIFGLTDALGNRDGVRAWALYQKALRAGGSPEELHGMLAWQTKAMLLTAAGSTEGLKPFVVTKAKRFLSRWSEPELKRLSAELVAVYHDARRGTFDLDVGLEQLLLGVLKGPV